LWSIPDGRGDQAAALNLEENIMTTPIYLDYNATTPIDPAVVDAMEPYLRDHFGNPSSDHAYGYRTRAAVQTAREQLAALLDTAPEEVVFTGGGSEANNLAIKGVAYALRARGNHLITSAVEHPAVAGSFGFLERQGYQVTVLPVDTDGRVDPAHLAAAITDQTILVSIMHANNEVGTIQPIRAIVDIAHARGVFVHTDAAQTIGKLTVRVPDLGVDLLTVAGHKFYAPQGVGALIVRQGVPLEPLIHGAGHEGGRRAGTENIPYVVALGRAAALAMERLPEYAERVRTLRDTLHRRILERIPTAVLNGHPVERLPNTLNLSFPGVNAAALLAAIRGQVACSTGSACHAGHAAPSQVLLAMGRDAGLAAAALRLSLGWATTAQQVQQAADVIGAAVPALTR
jgi:cysteine desulfurase